MVEKGKDVWRVTRRNTERDKGDKERYEDMKRDKKEDGLRQKGRWRETKRKREIRKIERNKKIKRIKKSLIERKQGVEKRQKRKRLHTVITTIMVYFCLLAAVVAAATEILRVGVKVN